MKSEDTVSRPGAPNSISNTEDLTRIKSLCPSSGKELDCRYVCRLERSLDFIARAGWRQLRSWQSISGKAGPLTSLTPPLGVYQT